MTISPVTYLQSWKPLPLLCKRIKNIILLILIPFLFSFLFVCLLFEQRSWLISCQIISTLTVLKVCVLWKHCVAFHLKQRKTIWILLYTIARFFLCFGWLVGVSIVTHLLCFNRKVSFKKSIWNYVCLFLLALHNTILKLF